MIEETPAVRSAAPTAQARTRELVRVPIQRSFGIAVLGRLAPSNVLGAALVGVAVGIGVGRLLQLPEVMLAQIIDADAVRTGHRREGAYFGVNGSVVRGSLALQAVVRRGAGGRRSPSTAASA